MLLRGTRILEKTERLEIQFNLIPKILNVLVCSINLTLQITKQSRTFGFLGKVFHLFRIKLGIHIPMTFR